MSDVDSIASALNCPPVVLETAGGRILPQLHRDF